MTRLNNKANTPMVSVWMITYNHEPYIAQAIEGVLMQKTNFPIELVIGEDCSTDNTAKIIKEYEAKYPKIIKARYNSPNLGMIQNMIKTLEECTGKYIAMCEGDDYWTDPYKLQKQVDFLEENKEYIICFHNVRIKKDGIITDDYITREVSETTTIIELAHGNYIHTPSVVFRKNKEVVKSFSSFGAIPAGDYALHMLNAKHGKIKKLNDIMCVYRIHGSNIWVSQDSQSMTIKIHDYLDVMIGNFTDEINQLLKKRYLDITLNLAKSYFSAGDHEKAKLYFQKLVQKNPEAILNEYIEATKPKTARYHCSMLKQKVINKLKFLTKL